MKVKPKLWQDSGTSAAGNYRSWLKRGPRYTAGNRDVTKLLELQCHHHCSQMQDVELWDLVSVMLNFKMLSLHYSPSLPFRNGNVSPLPL